MDEDVRGKIREALLQSYKHKPSPYAQCSVCGEKNRSYAMHLIECALPESHDRPSTFLMMSGSGGMVRGCFPICDSCAPRCNKCDLPVPTKKVRQFFDSITKQIGSKETSVHWGNGKCNHFHLFGP